MEQGSDENMDKWTDGTFDDQQNGTDVVSGGFMFSFLNQKVNPEKMCIFHYKSEVPNQQV